MWKLTYGIRKLELVDKNCLNTKNRKTEFHLQFDLNSFWLFKVKKLAKFELETDILGLTKIKTKTKL